MATVTRTCPVCYQEFQATVGKRGRPKVYDTEACREFAAAQATLTTWMEDVAERASPEAWLAIRKGLWALMNMRAWNKGVANKRIQIARAAAAAEKARIDLERKQTKLSDRTQRQQTYMNDLIAQGWSPGEARRLASTRLNSGDADTPHARGVRAFGNRAFSRQQAHAVGLTDRDLKTLRANGTLHMLGTPSQPWFKFQ